MKFFGLRRVLSIFQKCCGLGNIYWLWFRSDWVNCSRLEGILKLVLVKSMERDKRSVLADYLSYTKKELSTNEAFLALEIYLDQSQVWWLGCQHRLPTDTHFLSAALVWKKKIKLCIDCCEKWIRILFTYRSVHFEYIHFFWQIMDLFNGNHKGRRLLLRL